MTHHRRHREPGPVADQDLDRLLEAEDRLAARMEQARAEAQALLARADREAETRRRNVDEAAAAQRLEMHRKIEQERERRLRETTAHWQERAGRLDAIPEERLAQLADLLVRRVLGAPAGGADAE